MKEMRQQRLAKAYECSVSKDGLMLKGVVSRKKQLIPALIAALTEQL